MAGEFRVHLIFRSIYISDTLHRLDNITVALWWMVGIVKVVGIDDGRLDVVV